MTRKPLDAYYTPPELALTIIRRLDADGMIVRAPLALEPSAGEGAFVRALQTVRPEAQVTGADKDPSVAAAHGWECRAFEAMQEVGWDLIIGNPPYSQAEEHCRHAIAIARDGGTVAFLLRLGLLESAKRAPFWAQHPPARVYVLTERPSFTGGGTDSAAYGVFVWVRGYTGPTELRWLSWK